MARMDKFKDAFLPVAKQIEAIGFDSARVAAAFMKRAQPDYDAAQATIETLAVDLDRLAAEGGKRMDHTATLVMALLGAAVVLALVVIVPLTVMNMRSICLPLRKAEELADAIAQGDLSEREVDTRGGDEAAHLLQALATMQSLPLRRIVTQVRACTDSISSAQREIAAGNLTCRARTEQPRALEETASSMEELAATVRQNAENARQANQLARGAPPLAGGRRGGGAGRRHDGEISRARRRSPTSSA